MLQLDEMRSIYRNKLVQFTTDQAKGGSGMIFLYKYI